MNLAELQRKLIAAARANPPAERVPFAFEQRVTARLRSRLELDKWAGWARGLWRGAAACLAVTLLLAALYPVLPKTNPPSQDLSVAFENTMLASVDRDAASSPTW